MGFFLYIYHAVNSRIEKRKIIYNIHNLGVIAVVHFVSETLTSSATKETPVTQSKKFFLLYNLFKTVV